MNHIKPLLLTVSMAVVTPCTHAAEKFAVYDGGLDGDQRIYKVICPDGGRSTVTQNFRIDDKGTALVKTCIYSHTGKEECRERWDLDTAAKASCK